MAYSIEQIERAKELIIESMINGNSLVYAVESNKDIPSIRTVFNWLNPESDYHDAEFLHNYARAQDVRAEREFEQILSIADCIEHDVTIDKDGNEIINYNIINRDRLRVDARKWRISKMQPKKYGDKVDFTSNGKEITSITRTIIDESNNSNS